MDFKKVINIVYMKSKSFSSLILLFTALYIPCGFSQNISFGNAKLISNTDTVPSGKIYKVESIIYSSPIQTFTTSVNYNNLFINSTDDAIIINGSPHIVRSVRLGSAGAWVSVLWEQQFPIWLPAGTIISPSTGVRYINILEFNSIP